MPSGSKRRKLSNGAYEDVLADVEQPKQDTEAGAKDQRRSLFVRSLPASVTTERLTEHFSESFPLKHATVVVDPETNISRGFGFVTFADAEDAQAAVAQFNNSELDGRKIKVEVAESRQRDAEVGGKSAVNTTGVKLRAQREKSQGDTQAPKLIVRNLPWSIKTSEDLAALFRSYGKVKHAVVPKKNPKVQFGFGIVLLRGKKNAERALAGVNGKEIDGRTLAVDWAVDKDTWQKEQASGKENLDSKAVEGSADRSPKDDVDADSVTGDGEDLGEDAEEQQDSDEDPVDDFDAANADADDIESEAASEDEPHENKNDTTVFVRNLPYSTDDEALKDHFSTFGPVRYARVVYDQDTERPRGTAFVCFFNLEDAKACVKNSPKHELSVEETSKDKKRRGETVKHSVLENEASDPSGRYTLEGRVLQVARALSREGAERRANEASEKRDIRDRDKRRLYLLSEGSVANGTKLYELLGKAEIDIREASARQRQKLIKSSPNLCLSLTRLSVRNLPRGIDSKELKALAREAVVGFAKDCKEGIRQPLSKEEMRRGGPEMQEAEHKRKQSGKGIVRQAKVVFEDKEGSKVKEGAGRSRGYGFIEYVSHRNALAGLRWLNGHMVKPKNAGGEKGKRLIVEFAIENAQVLQRRAERERKSREEGVKEPRPGKHGMHGARKDSKDSKKRKRDDKDVKAAPQAKKSADPEEKNNLAKRNRIIAKKRQARKVRKG
ncbi:RNA recognition motif-containing protein [Cladophialophora chaetospira]|uniref:RNA recognition motif-containing protein n=1 Tax=Cladophialophora chaetospira TaxID=386627 RepID=A0AA39CGM5_9EURO|nr:RNA recognition motif-containing protein [Cladophialophora chaetospira]